MSLSNVLNRFWRLWALGDFSSLAEEADALEKPAREDEPEAWEEFLFLWAMALWQLGRQREAERKFKAVLKRNPQSTAARLQLANLLDDMGREEEAEAAFKLAAEQAPESAAVLVDWAIMRCRLEDFDRALELFDEADARGADDDNFHLYRALAYEAEGELESARDELTLFVTRGERDAFVLGRLASITAELGGIAEAELLAREALSISPGEVEPLRCLAVCLKDRGQFDEAEQTARDILADAPNHAEAWTLLGDIERERLELATARAHYEQALTISPRETFALSGLGDISLAAGDSVSAEMFAQLALGIDAGNDRALSLLRALRPGRETLNDYCVEIYGETADGARFFKSMDCLADDEDEARDFVASLQQVFPDETWWEFEGVCLTRRADETPGERRPGVTWISDYEYVDETAEIQ